MMRAQLWAGKRTTTASGFDVVAAFSGGAKSAASALATTRLAQAADDSGGPVVVHTSSRRGRPATPPRWSLTWATAAWAAWRTSGKEPVGASSWLTMPRTIAPPPLAPAPPLLLLLHA